MINFKNIFGGSYKMPDVPDTKVQEYIDKEAKAKKEEEKRRKGLPAYQIGRTEDGRVTLFLGQDGYGSTLTMNDTGVDTLIRMLEAAKEIKQPNDTEIKEDKVK